MEFRYRADDVRSPSSAVPRDAAVHPQPSIHARLVGSRIGRETPLTPRPIPATRRDMQKERIREEMIARDMAERRILEEEVRRELNMERDMGIRRGTLVDSLVLGPPPLPRHLLPETVMVERVLPRPLPRLTEFMYRDPVREVAALPEARVPEVKRREIEPVAKDHIHLPIKQELRKKKREERKPAAREYMSKSEVLGMKRKAKTKELETSHERYDCSLCQLIVTCERQLNEHLSGKKHKKKLAKLGTKDMGFTAKASISNASAQKKVVSLPQTNVPKEVNIMVNGKMNQVVRKEDCLWCMQCQVKCNSNVKMYAHLSGEKHLEHVGQSQSVNEEVKITGATTDMGENHKDMGFTAKASISNASAQKKVISLLQTNVPKEVNIMVNGKMSQVVLKEDCLWCMQCQVKCNSNVMMYAHLSGEKHLEHVGQSQSVKKEVKITGATTEDVKNKQAEVKERV